MEDRYDHLNGLEKTFTCKYKGNTTMSPDGKGNYKATKRRCTHPAMFTDQLSVDDCEGCIVYDPKTEVKS